MTRLPKLIVLSVIALLVFLPQPGETCGPFFNRAVFVREHGPDDPMRDFARGKIGVVLPDWYRAYRVVAYRYLEGNPLSQAEQESLQDHYTTVRRVGPPTDLFKAAGDYASLRARYRPGLRFVDTGYKETRNGFNGFQNCLTPAFETATETLRDRAQRFGASSPELQEWISGQDAVFRSCSSGNDVPRALPATANPLLRADRAYQIAAAEFYAGTEESYGIAMRDFQAIAADKSSPWHTIAPYLVARTLVRLAAITAVENQTYNPDYLAKAEIQLHAILNDPAQRDEHDDAKSLLSLVDFRLHPEQREAELGKLLADGDAGAHFGQDLVDYTWMLDRNTPRIQPSDDLSLWVFGGPGSKPPLDYWRAMHSMPWLVAVLWRLQPGDAAFDEVMEAAAKVPPLSEAFPTVSYFRARLARESGDDALARQVIEAALGQSRNLPLSAVHLFEDEKMQVVANLDTFESRLSETPLEFDNGDGVSGPAPCGEDTSDGCGPHFSPVAATLLNTRIPVDFLGRIGQSPKVPADLRRRLAVSVWARAALLNKSDVARQMAASAQQAEPALKPYIQKCSEAQTREEHQFATAFAILHFPGMRPYVDAAFPRQTAFGEIDDLRDNWWTDDVGGNMIALGCPSNWCFQVLPQPQSKGPAPSSASASRDWMMKVPNYPLVGFPAFLSSDQKQRAVAEWQELSALGSASHYLPRVVLDWGKAHPKDPRVPEALYLSVRAMRYGSSNEWSYQAFEMLHKNYPQSEWARLTPYWYK